jgi:hypothetical protein
VGRWRGTAAFIVLVALSVAATAASGASPRLYTVEATKACLESVSHAINGLPPAIPPSPAARFVAELPRDRWRFYRSASGQLGVFYGHRTKGAYAGAILTFFKSESAARAYLKDLLSPARRERNVAVDWGYGQVSEPGWRDAVLGCLRAGRLATPAPKRAVPRASLATFAGHWGGHTRRLQITPGGRGLEITDDGCCVRIYRTTFQILSVSGTLTRATATYRVISHKRHEEYGPRLHAGQIGKLRLNDGILTNTLTRVFFCSHPAWWATGACGA